MRTILSLLLTVCVVSGAAAQVQTNTYTAPMVGVAKVNKTWPHIACDNFFYNGVASYHASTVASNRYYLPDTNVINITFTNADALIYASSTLGQEACGKSSLTFTDVNFPNPSDKWAFAVYWPTNLVVPTNALIPINVVGVHTNSP